MGALAILSAIGSAAMSIAKMVQVKRANQSNLKQVEETNATNLQLAREANVAQAQESEKAYQRNMPSNQVAQLKAAGMSKAGAINTLNGGASYTPAAVNTAQVQAYQEDPSSMLNALDSVANIGQQLQAQSNWKKEFERSKLESDRQYEIEKEKAAKDNELKQQQIIAQQIQNDENRLHESTRRYMSDFVDAYHSIEAKDYTNMRDFYTKFVEKLSPEASKAFKEDSAAYDLVAGWIKRDTLQVGETSDVNLKVQTEQANIDRILNESKLSEERLNEMAKKLKFMDLQYGLTAIAKKSAELQYSFQSATYDSDKRREIAENISRAVEADYRYILAFEKTEAYNRLSAKEKKDFADTKLAYEMLTADTDSARAQNDSKKVGAAVMNTIANLGKLLF